MFIGRWTGRFLLDSCFSATKAVRNGFRVGAGRGQMTLSIILSGSLDSGHSYFVKAARKSDIPIYGKEQELRC
jgi:hypothetical protein